MESKSINASSPSSAPLKIRMFGTLEVQIEGRSFPPVRSRYTLWLLALLALKQGRPVDRISLAKALWPIGQVIGNDDKRTEAQTLANLRQRLTELRKHLGAQAGRLTEPSPGMLCLNLEDADVDVLAFDSALQCGDPEALARAVDLYGDYGLLQDWPPAIIAAIQLPRDQRRRQFLQTLRRLAEHALERDDFAEAAHYWKLMEHSDPSAVPQVVPESEGTTWSLSILPQPLTSLVGRAQEIREVLACLRVSHCRLISLIGPGGVGKTRLAIATAAAAADWFADGICFVDLAPVRDPMRIPQAVAAALKVREQPGQTIRETLREVLRNRSLLLVLDNCEHLLEAAAGFVVQLLEACGRIHVLATSREALNIIGEQRYPVNSLDVPALPHAGQAGKTLVDAVSQTAVAQLFVQYAGLQRYGFALTPQNALHVARICRRLDGIPLAIELAAACLPALAVEDLDRRLQDSLRILDRNHRSAQTRHQTLRAMMDWSYDLLSRSEQGLLRRLSVFAGGWPLAAAEQVCADAIDPAVAPSVGHPDSLPDALPGIPAGEILGLLTSLVDKSLVQLEAHNGQTRYRMLEIIREYAGEKLRQSAESVSVQSRHADWCLALAEEAEAKLIGAEQGVWLQRLDREHDNLRVALEVVSAAEAGLRLASALRRYWIMRGFAGEGRRCLERSLEQCRNASEASRAKAQYAAGTLATMAGDWAVAQRFLEESLDLYGRLGDDRGIATALNNLADVWYSRGEYHTARPYYERSLDIWRALEDRWCTAVLLSNLGTVAIHSADYTAARSYLEQSLTLFQGAGDAARVASILDRLGALSFQQKDYATARRYYESSLERLRGLGDRRITARALLNLSTAIYELEGHEQAAPFVVEGLRIQHELGDKNGLVFALRLSARIAIDRQEFSKAVRLLAVTETLSKELGIEHTSQEQADIAQDMARLRCELAAETFQYHWAEGLTMSLEEAVNSATT